MSKLKSYMCKIASTAKHIIPLTARNDATKSDQKSIPHSESQFCKEPLMLPGLVSLL